MPIEGATVWPSPLKLRPSWEKALIFSRAESNSYSALLEGARKENILAFCLQRTSVITFVWGRGYRSHRLKVKQFQVFNRNRNSPTRRFTRSWRNSCVFLSYIICFSYFETKNGSIIGAGLFLVWLPKECNRRKIMRVLFCVLNYYVPRWRQLRCVCADFSCCVRFTNRNVTKVYTRRALRDIDTWYQSIQHFLWGK